MKPTSIGNAEPERRARRLLWALGAAVFMVNLDARVVAPLLPTLTAELGVSLARSAWLVSAYMLPGGPCQIGFGPLADLGSARPSRDERRRP